MFKGMNIHTHMDAFINRTATPVKGIISKNATIYPLLNLALGGTVILRILPITKTSSLLWHRGPLHLL